MQLRGYRYAIHSVRDFANAMNRVLEFDQCFAEVVTGFASRAHHSVPVFL
jgi:hypothetical protein